MCRLLHLGIKCTHLPWYQGSPYRPVHSAAQAVPVPSYRFHNSCTLVDHVGYLWLLFCLQLPVSIVVFYHAAFYSQANRIRSQVPTCMYSRVKI